MSAILGGVMPHFPSPRLWRAVIALGVLDVIWMLAAGMRLTPGNPTAVAVAGGALAALYLVGQFYQNIRRDAFLQQLAQTFLFFALFTQLMVLTSYLGATLALPLRDAALASADQALGFDWLAVLSWINERPRFGWALIWAYHSSGAQILIMLGFLCIVRNPARIAEFLTLYAATGATTLVLAIVFPAAGAYVYYAPPGELFSNLNQDAGLWHLEQFNALREGAMRTIVASEVEGLITFPSFHTIMALLTVYAVRGYIWIFVPFAALNFLVLLSTISEGGHHLVDVLASMAITVCAVLIYRSWSRTAAGPGWSAPQAA